MIVLIHFSSRCNQLALLFGVVANCRQNSVRGVIINVIDGRRLRKHILYITNVIHFVYFNSTPWVLWGTLNSRGPSTYYDIIDVITSHIVHIITNMTRWLANREENFVLMTFSKQNVKRVFGGFTFLKNVWGF